MIPRLVGWMSAEMPPRLCTQQLSKGFRGGSDWL